MPGASAAACPRQQRARYRPNAASASTISTFRRRLVLGIDQDFRQRLGEVFGPVYRVIFLDGSPPASSPQSLSCVGIDTPRCPLVMCDYLDSVEDCKMHRLLLLLTAGSAVSAAAAWATLSMAAWMPMLSGQLELPNRSNCLAGTSTRCCSASLWPRSGGSWSTAIPQLDAPARRPVGRRWPCWQSWSCWVCVVRVPSG